MGELSRVGCQPGLAIVQVGCREDSNVYIRKKLKVASEIGIHAEHIQLPRSVTEHDLISKVSMIEQTKSHQDSDLFMNIFRFIS